MADDVKPQGAAPADPQPALLDPSIVSGARRRTHAEIRARALRAAQGFVDLGVREGDTVGLLLRNDFAFFEATLGASLAGAYPVPLNWHATPDEAGYILRDSGARALIAHADLLPGVAAGVPVGLPVKVVATPPEIAAAYGVPPAAAPADLDWEAWLDGLAPLATPSTAARSAVIYTSGTTGRPKGVRRAPDPDGRAGPTALAGYALDPTQRMTVLMNGPMYHTAPNTYAQFALGLGADLVLQARFDAEELLRMIEQHRITHMHIVPTMFVRLLRLPDAVKAKYDLSSLRAVVHGAAPCPPAVKRAMIEWWGNVIFEYYGSSETGLACGHGSQEALDRPGTVGRALPGVSIRILGENGEDLPAGEPGDIFVHSQTMPDFTYIGQDDKRREIAAGAHVTVGDVGYLDAEGYLFLCDRRRDMIISGGVNIYSAEIEAALQAIPEIGDCAVFGVPDEEFGEAVFACVQPADPARGVDVTAVRVALGESLSRYKIPRRIEVLDSLPREDSGKIFKRKLREIYSNG